MDYLVSIVILAQRESPSFWRLVGPVMMVAAIALFGWLNERARKKMAEQQEQEKARRRGKGEIPAEQERGIQQTRVGPMRRPGVGPEEARGLGRGRAAEQIQRYRPEIPSAGRRAEQVELDEEEEAELVIVAQDVSGEAAKRQFQELQRQQQLRSAAIRRTRALQAAQRKRQVALEASQAARKAANDRRGQELRGREGLAGEQASGWGELLPVASGSVSGAQIRRAIVWAEILGRPRALRPYGEGF